MSQRKSEPSDEDKTRNDILHHMNDFRAKECYCDLTVVIGDQRFPCHQLVLASVSEYFHSLFTSPLWNKSDNTTVLENVDSRSFEIILEYAYSGVLNINDENSFDLLKSGDFLGMRNLTPRCLQYVEKNPNVLNILNIYSYALHPMKDLEFARNISRYIPRRLDEITKTSEFLEISFRTLKTMFEDILYKCPKNLCPWCRGRDDYYDFDDDRERYYSPPNPPSRQGYSSSRCEWCNSKYDLKKILLPCLVKWINHDIIERKKYFHKLAVLIELPTEYLEGCESMMICLENKYLGKSTDANDEAPREVE